MMATAAMQRTAGLRVLKQGPQIRNLVAMATGAEGLSRSRTNDPVLVVESIL
jgi:hypothetical protein